MKPLPESADDIYALAQGPLTLNREKREAEADEADQSVRVASKGKRQSRDSVLFGTRERFQWSLEHIKKNPSFCRVSLQIICSKIDHGFLLRVFLLCIGNFHYFALSFLWSLGWLLRLIWF